MSNEQPRMISLAEALPEECQRRLVLFVNAFSQGKLLLEPGKSVRVLLRERVLDPFKPQLEATWDLDYLSYAVCWAVYNNTGVDMLDY